MKVEWLILADAAQSIGNKLYLLGGGWDSLTVNSLPANQYCAISIAYLVPWNETNQRHNVQLQIVHDDHRETTLLEVGAQIEVGRPPGIPPGSEQRTQFTMSAVLTLAWPGTYVITAQIEGQPPENGGRTVFRVVPGPQLTTRSPS